MTISLGVFFIFLVFAMAGGIAIGWLAAVNRHNSDHESLQTALTQARERALLLQGRCDQLELENAHLHDRVDDQGSTAQVLAPISQQLGQVDAYVRALESKTAQRFSAISTQLQADAQVSMQLTRTAESLNAALRNSSVRGSWGEVQLRRIIESSGMLERVDFDEQLSNSQVSADAQSGGRPDVTVHLPNGAHVAIDSKVPMASYIAAHDIPATDLERAGERAELMRSHAKAVRQHVMALKKRNYPGDFPQSPQLTIMFLPSEALLAEALDSDSSLLESALQDGIILASPATLLALLRSIAAIWRSAQASEEARDIVLAGQELVDRLSVFVKHLHKLGSSLTTSVKSYNSAMSSLESRVLVTYRKFESLGEKAHILDTQKMTISTEEGTTRQSKAPEFNISMEDDHAS